ncbi:MAG TPA: hypothetical protein VH139_06465 [Acidobacteriaceae bacterium]|jgi:hypothetical protein|nr:hypothetical protein [Acidobacteriaceae bacterium]
MQRHPAFSKLHRYLLTAALAGFIPTAMARAQTDIAGVSLPDAPVPQQSTAPAGQPASTTQPASTSGPANAEDQQQKKQLTSDEVLRQEEQQRAFGVMPMFQTVSLANSKNIPPLRPKQKFRLMLKSTTDPFIFAQGAVLSGIGQARDTNSGTKTVTNPDGTTSQVRWGFGQGASGYFKRFGASYVDTADGNFWGNAVLPVLLKEDPRYYRMGYGSFVRRFSYSAETALWCRRDNGTWGPNYANVAGNFISGGISNLYYPDEDSGFEKTVIGAMTVTAEGVIGSELIEFLPDIEHYFLKNRHPRL